LACGTGVIASSLVLQSLKEEQFYDLVAPGGELQVEINDKEVSLLGPAELVYTGEFQLRRFNV
jgi:diaminopimelate epimerase